MSERIGTNPDLSIIALDRYHSRGANAYFAFLFPEDPYPVNIRGRIARRLAKIIVGYYKWLEAKDTTDENTASLAGKYFHLSLDDEEVISTPCSVNEVRQEFGRKEYFFRRGAKILDIGCGVGKAVSELTKIYKPRGVKIVGLNLPSLKPINPSIGYYVGGNWATLPFKNGTFDGILGCESFPVHRSRYSDQATVQEIIRVSHPGTIWRATLPLDNRRGEVLTGMLIEGWDVYLGPRSFIAKLQ